MSNVIETLQKRGFIDAITSENLKKTVEKPIKLYVGFDPTSDSLHLGNLVGILLLRWFQKFGHQPIAVVGGATGMIGDPSGKSHERNLLDSKAIEKNLQGIKSNLEKILDFSHVESKAKIINNYDWFSKKDYVGFLRDIGKHFRLGPMLSKESVKTRLNSQEGMSYTEFSYQILQAYDFYHLYANENILLQAGGSDQWGNITAGIDLVKKLTTKEVYGLTFPLLTRSGGKKFGKSEKGAIWLSKDKLSPYEFYQYLFRTPDEDVITMMKMLTFMDLEEISSYKQLMHASDYRPNTCQKKLAEEVTLIVHGEDGLQLALNVTKGMSPGSKTRLDGYVLKQIAKEAPLEVLPRDEVMGMDFVELVVKIGFASSKGEVKRLIKNGGIYLNNEKVSDEKIKMEEQFLIDEEFILVAIGKKKKLLLQIK